MIRGDEVMERKIPKDFQSTFWDTNINTLDIEENKIAIISRILTFGSDQQYLWLKDTYSDEDFILTALESRNLDPIVANYLRKKYDLREEDMVYYTMVETSPVKFR